MVLTGLKVSELLNGLELQDGLGLLSGLRILYGKPPIRKECT